MFSTSSNEKDGLREVMAEVLATAKVKYVFLNGPGNFPEFKKSLSCGSDDGPGLEVQSTWN